VAYGTARRGGTASVVVDGETLGTVSFEGGTKAPRFRTSRTWGRLGTGRHTVRLVMRGRAGYVDHFVVPGLPGA
jgi:hypothetical protein